MSNNYTINILIADDNREIHKDFIKILNQQTPDNNYVDLLEAQLFGGAYLAKESTTSTKFIIDSALSGTEAISKVKDAFNKGIQYALAFIDIRMPPGIDGIETITKIWKIDPDIQMVICTAYSDYNWHQAIKNIGNNDNLLILKKPFDYMTVHQLTKSLIKKWLLYKETSSVVPKLMNNISSSHDNLIYQATHDALTKLPNRNLLYERIDYTISLSNRNQSLFAIVYLDLDDFKIINDTLGHEAGDAVLQSISASLLDNIRKHDTVFRIGGDEFIILLTNIKQDTNIPAIASNILHTIQKDIPYNSKYLNVTPSMGISIFPYNGKTTIELINNADLAMYQAKELGGNQFQFYTEEINQKISSQAKIEMQIKDGLTNNQFFLSYLPQINLKYHTIAAAEALIRLSHPTLGIICPATFIPIAEKSGLILQLGEWTLKSAIQQNALWQTKQLPKILVSAHISIQHLRQRNFIRSIEKYLAEFNLSPEYLGIELAENIFIANSQTIKILEKLKSLGVKIILDNFGSGSMSLNYLQQIPIDFLKLDRSLIKTLQQNKNNVIITKSIINITKGLGIEIIAEGVENEFQEKFLYENFCYYAQGYYFSKPMLANELEKLLQK